MPTANSETPLVAEVDRDITAVRGVKDISESGQLGVIQYVSNSAMLEDRPYYTATYAGL
jgi:hypothetical protein